MTPVGFNAGYWSGDHVFFADYWASRRSAVDMFKMFFFVIAAAYVIGWRFRWLSTITSDFVAGFSSWLFSCLLVVVSLDFSLTLILISPSLRLCCNNHYSVAMVVNNIITVFVFVAVKIISLLLLLSPFSMLLLLLPSSFSLLLP